MRDQVGEIVACAGDIIRTGFDFVDRIFLGIGVQIAHDDEVGVAAAGRVGGEPVHQGFRRGAAGLAAVALTVPRSGSPTSRQSEPLDLRWLTTTVKRAPVALTSKVCASDGRFLVSMKRGSTAEVEQFEIADRGDDGGTVDHADLDRIGADGAGGDVVVARHARDDAGQRLDAGGVLHFVQADDVGIETGKRREKFVALAGEFGGLVTIPAAAFHVVERAALVIQRRPLGNLRVTKKLSVFIAATRTVPPTGSGAAGRGFAAA